MDFATLFKMTMRACSHQTIKDYLLLVDALNDANLSTEAEHLYNICRIVESVDYAHFSRIMEQQLFLRVGSEQFVCKRMHDYYRIAPSPSAISAKESTKILKDIFSGKTFAIERSSVLIPFGAAFLQYALDIVDGIPERLDVTHADPYNIKPTAVIQAAMAFLFKE